MIDLSAGLEAALDGEHGPACRLDESGRIVFMNATWNDWVVPAGAQRATAEWLLGRRWVDSIEGEQHGFFARLFEMARELPAHRGAWLVHTSECNTPVLIRKSTTMLAPVRTARATEVVIVYDLSDLGPPQDVYGAPTLPFDAFVGADGAVVQCGDCRRVFHAPSKAWQFVSAALAHGVRKKLVACATCRARFMVPPTVV